MASTSWAGSCSDLAAVGLDSVSSWNQMQDDGARVRKYGFSVIIGNPTRPKVS